MPTFNYPQKCSINNGRAIHYSKTSNLEEVKQLTRERSQYSKPCGTEVISHEVGEILYGLVFFLKISNLQESSLEQFSDLIAPLINKVERLELLERRYVQKRKENENASAPTWE